MNEQETPPEIDDIMYIPKCCLELHDDCPHVINKEKEKERKNSAI